MASIFTSSIGKKLIQSISGAFLILFLLLHGTINFFSVIDSFTGSFGKPDGLYQLGCDFMSLPIIKPLVPVLALGFLVHILWGMWLSYGNIKARGGLKRYEVPSKAKADSWSAKNMLVLGLLVLLGIACHLSDFWAKMQLQEFLGREAENPYELLTGTFGQWWLLCLYLAWFVVIWLHLNHGFWSMFQSIGWNNMIWLKRLRVIGTVVASLIIFLFVASAVNAFLQAHLWI
ncbi:MAG: succinate dehydrogenase [Bacteroidales bacterium]|nr:succinate dehydrogenase [Bacteroidales bacterium]